MILIVLEKNVEKYITFSVPINKESDNGETVIYKLKFTDSYRFMSTSLLNFVYNLSGFNKMNANHVWKEKISNHNAILSILKIRDLFTDAKNLEKNAQS